MHDVRLSHLNKDYLLTYLLIVDEFGEITQNKDHYDVQGHSRSPILIQIETSYTSSY